MKSLALVFGLSLVACGGSAPSSTTTTTPVAEHHEDHDHDHGGPEDDSSPVVGPPQVAWKDMTHQQQARFMAKVVMPKFKPMFQKFDGKMFAKFECDTCHAKATVADHSFKMPNPDIYVLPESEEDFGKILKAKPEWMKLMGEVEHEMAGTLGLPPYNPAAPDPTQFGCYGCHTHKAGGAGDL